MFAPFPSRPFPSRRRGPAAAAVRRHPRRVLRALRTVVVVTVAAGCAHPHPGRVAALPACDGPVRYTVFNPERAPVAVYADNMRLLAVVSPGRSEVVDPAPAAPGRLWFGSEGTDRRAGSRLRYDLLCTPDATPAAATAASDR